MTYRDAWWVDGPRRLGQWLVAAPPSVRSPEERSRLRVLCVLSLAGLVAVGGIDVAFLVASEHYSVPAYLYVMIAVVYVAGRCGYRRAGATLLVYIPAVSALVRVGTGVAYNPLVPLMALAVPPLVAAILLTWADVLVLLVVDTMVPLVLVAVVPERFQQPAAVAGPIALTFIVSVLVLAFMHQRDHLERLRQRDLREREKHYRALVANVPGVVYRLAGRGDRCRIAYVSDGIRELAGLDPAALLAGGHGLADLVHEDDRARVWEERQRSLAEAGAYALEYRVVARDGGVRWVLDRGHEVREGQDPADCVDGVLIDISAHKAAVAEQERLAAIVEATSDLVATAGADGVLRYMNRSGRRLLGWTPDEDVTAHRIVETHPPWATEIVERQGIPTATSAGVWAGETAMLDSNGREIPVSQVIMAHRTETGALAFLSTIVRDLSERAASEAARTESEERFRLLAGAAFEGIAITEHGRIVDANEQLGAMLGLGREQLIGRAVMDFVAPQSREEVLAHLRRLSEEPYEHLARRDDGSVFPVEARGRSIPLGGHLQRVTALRDLTERKQAEEARAALERRALHGQKLESLGVLAGGIAHDFNNLLVAVLGNLDLALAGLPPDAPQRRHLEQAEHAVQQGAALSRELLAYSGRGRFVVRPIDLSRLVEEGGQLLRAAIPRSIRLETHLERPLALVMADASQIQQVVMNLIVNAAEAIGERPGTITLRTGAGACDGELMERSRLLIKPPPGRFVHVQVTDDGCGMTAETMERLFDPFFSTKLAGRGLGMAAVQGIVQGHGGAIVVDSVPGEGSTFSVYLPQAPIPFEGTAADTSPAVRGRAKPEPGGLVMLVDDEETVLQTARAMLEHLGFSVVTAADGREASDLFGRVGESVVLVVLDLTMPDMDGLETLAELRRVRPDVPVLLASGFDETEISERCGAHPPDGFLQKPYSLAALRAAIEGVLLGPGPDGRAPQG